MAFQNYCSFHWRLARGGVPAKFLVSVDLHRLDGSSCDTEYPIDNWHLLYIWLAGLLPSTLSGRIFIHDVNNMGSKLIWILDTYFYHILSIQIPVDTFSNPKKLTCTISSVESTPPRFAACDCSRTSCRRSVVERHLEMGNPHCRWLILA